MTIHIRKALCTDLPVIVQLFVQDQLGATREHYEEPLPEKYYAAYAEIMRDQNNHLIVAEFEKQVIGTLQLTFITSLTFQGGRRALIEGVHIHSEFQRRGFGKEMLTWAIDKAKAEGCCLVQLTTNKKREPSAVGFYKKIGFIDSHEGLKLYF